MGRPPLLPGDKKYQKTAWIRGHDMVLIKQRYGSIQKWVDLAAQHERTRRMPMVDLEAKAIGKCSCGKVLTEHNTTFIEHLQSGEVVVKCKCKRKNVVSGPKEEKT